MPPVIAAQLDFYTAGRELGISRDNRAERLGSDAAAAGRPEVPARDMIGQPRAETANQAARGSGA